MTVRKKIWRGEAWPSLTDLGVVEQILRDRQQFFADIRDDVALRHKLRAMFVSSTVFLGLYGAVLGSQHSPLQAVSSGLKLPVLFIVTLLVCAPTLYFFNIFFGAHQRITQNVALILTAITVTAVLLVAFAPITLFFLLSTSQYQFFKLLNVAVFGIAGGMGILFLSQGMQVVNANGDAAGQQARRWVMRVWMVIYMFVGCQLAWTIRPFIGAPGIPFEPFRQLGGNFYTNIIASLGEIFGFFIVQ